MKKNEELPVMLKVEDVARILGIGIAGAHDLVRAPGFPALYIGRRIRIPKEDFFRWIEERGGKVSQTEMI